MANLIQHKRSTTGGNTPTLAEGELGINLVDKRLFTANSTVVFDAIQNVASNFSLSGNFNLTIGNSTINATGNSTALKIMNSTSNALFSIPTTTQWNGNFFLHANGSWVTPTATATPGGANTNIQFNDSGALGGSAGFTFNTTTNTIAIGNSTINLIANSTTLKISNSTVNTFITIPTAAQYSATNYFLHANGSWVSVNSATRVYEQFAPATSGCTTFTVTGGYTPGTIDVFYNGIKLANDEFTQNTTAIVLDVGANSGAIVEVVGYKDVSLVNIGGGAIGSNTQIQYNDSGNMAGAAGFTYNNTTNNVLIANTLTIGNSTINVAANSSNIYINNHPVVGKQSIWVPASALTSRTTNGFGSGTAETTTNKNMLKSADFDTATQEYGQLSFQLPKGWDIGTLTFQPIWSHANTTTNFGVVWLFEGTSYADTDPLDNAFGAAVRCSDTGGVNNAVYIGAESAALTIGNSPATGDWIMVQVSREVANTNDTLGIDARLHGFMIKYNTTQNTDD